jgi:hypothetical protein
MVASLGAAVRIRLCPDCKRRRASVWIDRSHGDHSTDIDVFQRAGFAAWEILEVKQDEIDYEAWIEKLEDKAEFFESAHGAYDVANAALLRGSVAAIRHLLQAQTWRPIEEAPESIPFADVFVVTRRDGGLVCQMRVPNAQHRDGKWYDNGGYEINNDTIEPDGVHYVRAITHFMEQPNPPSSDEERASATPSDQQNEGEA